jgi:hypothetical protein
MPVVIQLDAQKPNHVLLVPGSLVLRYFSWHALYFRYCNGSNLNESFDSRPLLYSKTELKYRYLDYWTV